MIIHTLELSSFRNYGLLHMDFSDGINIFCGDNAQGKTNILEAIYLCSTNKSHRGAKDREMISFGGEEAHLKMMALKGDMDYRIDMHLKKNRNKGIAVNSVPIRRTSDYLGLIKCVFFSPEDLQIVKEGPSERRRFMDTELCMLDKIYLNALTQYKKALDQRNQLLKDISFEPSLMETLDLWDSQLVRFGKDIIDARKKFIGELRDIVTPVHSKLSGEREVLSVDYEPDVTSEEFDEEIKKSRDRDLRSKTTNRGPHRDDMSFLITTKKGDGEQSIDARIYGSQGQMRTCALSLKMSEIELLKRKTGDMPVLLLDDVLSELDSGRQQFLLNSIQGIQTMITCTGLEDFVRHQFEVHRVYRVIDGTVTEEKSYEQ